MHNDDNVTNTEETTANQTTVATETGNGTNDQGSPAVSQNGQDGGNTEEAEEQHYTLDEILKSDPAIKAEYDRKMQAAIAKHDARLARRNSNGVQQEVGWKQEGNKVMISDSDFQKMLDSVKNKKYVNNLLASHGIMSTHGYIR